MIKPLGLPTSRVSWVSLGVQSPPETTPGFTVTHTSIGRAKNYATIPNNPLRPGHCSGQRCNNHSRILRNRLKV
uniref:Uncharacterized protein n=1 Tax=Siphoviridae sp. ctGkF2 TaxID=2827823 RepID=A0A8S5TLW0_9CAUD|nr:MAG TPA: hypothetical protein [Siphoviridae sp. ctGkF2]